MSIDDGANLLFANAMWRSGSTYLAGCFARSDRYMLFYEPCHEGVGRSPSAQRTRDRGRLADRRLRHPALDVGYFDSYDLADPLTGKKLRELYPASMALRDVYNAASDAALVYLAACGRVARAQGKIAFLGFCRSGTQHARAESRLGGGALHLWRSPREQFRSYDWPRNDYFVPGTLLQLLFSERLRPVLLGWSQFQVQAFRLKLLDLVAESRPRHLYRIGRWIASELTQAQAYALFYTSWRVSYSSARATARFSFSLTHLGTDDALRCAIESEYGIVFENLRPTPSDETPDIAYDVIEKDIDTLLALAGWPASSDPDEPVRPGALRNRIVA